MFKIRYEVETGKVNLLTNGTEEVPVAGCAYMTVDARPQFDDTKENLYVKGGRVVAVPAEE